jgi:hypothetical protein
MNRQYSYSIFFSLDIRIDALEHSFESLHGNHGDKLNAIAIRHDFELGPCLETHAFPDFLRDDNLKFT